MATVSRRGLFLGLLIGTVVVGAAAYYLWYSLVGRYFQTTDDAYVHANIVRITPRISGAVQRVYVDDTDRVVAGQVLAELDPTTYRINLNRMAAEYEIAVAEIQENKAVLSQRQADLAIAADDATRATAQMLRRRQLAKQGMISLESMADYDHLARTSETRVMAAQQAVRAAMAKLSQNADLPPFEHPSVVVAANNLRRAREDLADTIIRAPVAGVVAKRNVQVGQHVAPGEPLLAVVQIGSPWIEANFKETQLQNIRVGQSASVAIDAFGGTRLKARVVGIGSGTGSAFSLLPPQNATGNWIKIVQRIPTKLILVDPAATNYPLSVGMSATVTIDTHETKPPQVASRSAQRSHAR